MAFINTIRKRSGIVFTFITLGLLLFLFGRDLLSIHSIFRNKNSQVIGKINHESILFTDFQHILEKARYYFYLQHQRYPSPEVQARIRDEVWENMVLERMYQQSCQNLSLTVSDEEMIDMIQGDHIHPELVQAFTDPKTKKFDKKDIITYLENIAQASHEKQKQWQALESSLKDARLKKKLHTLLQKSIYINNLEAEKKQKLQSIYKKVQYCWIPHQNISPSSTEVTEDMVKNYYEKHKKKYAVKESRAIVYVALPIVPYSKTVIDFEKELTSLAHQFAISKDCHQFLKMHTDDHQNTTQTLTEKQMFSLFPQEKKFYNQQVLGPVKQGQVYQLFKVVATYPKEKKYDLLVLTKEMTVGDQEKNNLFRQASLLTKHASSVAEFKAYAAKNNFTIYTSTAIHEDSHGIDQHHTYAREIVRWLYNEAKPGRVSSVFEVNQHYMVAMMTQKNKKRFLPLAEVSSSIKKILEKKNSIQKKYHMLQKEIQSGITLEIIAQKYKVKIMDHQLTFDQRHLPVGGGSDNEFLGVIFGNVDSKKIYVRPTREGLWLFLVKQQGQMKEKTTTVADYKKQNQQLAMILQNFNFKNYLKQLADIQDQRHNFY